MYAYLKIPALVKRNGREYAADLYRYLPISPKIIDEYFVQYDDCARLYFIPVDELKELIKDTSIEEEVRKELKEIYNIAKEEGIEETSDYIEIVIL